MVSFGNLLKQLAMWGKDILDRFVCFQASNSPNDTFSPVGSELSSMHGISVIAQTIRNRLHKSNLHTKLPIRAPGVSHGKRTRRLEFTEEIGKRSFQAWEEWIKIWFATWFKKTDCVAYYWQRMSLANRWRNWHILSFTSDDLSWSFDRFQIVENLVLFQVMTSPDLNAIKFVWDMLMRLEESLEELVNLIQEQWQIQQHDINNQIINMVDTCRAVIINKNSEIL